MLHGDGTNPFSLSSVAFTKTSTCTLVDPRFVLIPTLRVDGRTAGLVIDIAGASSVEVLNNPLSSGRHSKAYALELVVPPAKGFRFVLECLSCLDF